MLQEAQNANEDNTADNEHDDELSTSRVVNLDAVEQLRVLLVPRGAQELGFTHCVDGDSEEENQRKEHGVGAHGGEGFGEGVVLEAIEGENDADRNLD